jgi:RNA polymerase sigma factor (sigma-70 family)
VPNVSALVGAAAAGDQHAWNALVARFDGLVWAVARAHRLSGADAADVVQTTWLRLVEHLERLDDPERVGAWLATTARRESFKALKRAARQVPTAPDEVPVPAIDGRLDAGLLATERDQALWHAFAGLDPECQALLRMLVADPTPSYDEISEALGRPIGSIGPTRARCLEKLRLRATAGGLSRETGSTSNG